jgi:hypothetical protein
MKPARKFLRAIQSGALLGVFFGANVLAREPLGQEPRDGSSRLPTYASAPMASLGQPTDASLGQPSANGMDYYWGRCETGDGCGNCESGGNGGVYAGGEFLWLRAHFSEAVAFVRTTTTLTPAGVIVQTNAEELDFDYEPSFRFFVGYQFAGGAALELTYWYFDSDTTADGVVALPNQTITDPFGNVATPGQSVRSTAGVRMNVFDLDIAKTVSVDCMALTLRGAAGLRLADIDQDFVISTASAAGTALSRGDFDASFVGVGPHLGLGANLGRRGPLSLFARSNLSLLIGDYDVNAAVTFPGLRVGQSASRTRAVPVLEAALGAAWRLSPNLTLSAGWEFQSWFNVGTSGGRFQPLVGPPAFVGTDDADIMSFDGLFLRAQFSF